MSRYLLGLLGSFFLFASFILGLFILIGQLSNKPFINLIAFVHAINPPSNLSYQFGLWQVSLKIKSYFKTHFTCIGRTALARPMLLSKDAMVTLQHTTGQQHLASTRCYQAMRLAGELITYSQPILFFTSLAPVLASFYGLHLFSHCVASKDEEEEVSACLCHPQRV